MAGPKQGPAVPLADKSLMEILQCGQASDTKRANNGAARKIAHLIGETEGGAYQMLLVALIEDERLLDPRGFND
jgi:hypothetical protein